MRISNYKKQGFEGLDVNLETSLFEYGLIWKEYRYNLKKRGIVKGEILAIAYDTETKWTNYGYFRKDELLSETWINWDSVCGYCGLTMKQLSDLSAGHILFTLISYYGPVNFGLDI